MRSLLLLSPALLGVALTAADVKFEDVSELGKPTKEYLAQREQLEKMLAESLSGRQRDLELYELEFTPLRMDRVIVTGRNGRERVFNYLAFRVRNQATADAAQLVTKAKGYNQVLQTVTAQYEKAKIATEGGVALRVDGIEGKEGVVLERQDAKPRERTVSLTAWCWDERGTRIAPLHEAPVTRNRGVLDRDGIETAERHDFLFSDQGDATAASNYREVREAIEDRMGQRLLSLDELRGFSLPPFDGQARVQVEDINDPKYDLRGWYVGEAYGVVVFNRLSDHGNRFTIEMHGLSNKFRPQQVVLDDATGAKPGNYLEQPIRRRTFVLKYNRPGDEYFRDLDSFDQVEAGWIWVDSYQRQRTRSTVAYSRWFLNTVNDGKGGLNPAINGAFWPWYAKVRDEYVPKVKEPDKDLPDLQKTIGKRE